jgi:hypothetical protein
LLVGNRLRLDAGCNLATNKVLDESSNLLLGQVLSLKGIFLVLDGVLDSKRRKLVGGKIQIAGVSSKGLCIDGGKVDLAFVELGDGLEGGREGGSLFRGLCEDVGERDTGL